MNSNDYWQKQPLDKPLFPDVLWSKPERRDTAGKLAIVGGNSRGFASVAAAYQTALSTGVGQAQVILPDILKRPLSSQSPTSFGEDGLTPNRQTVADEASRGGHGLTERTLDSASKPTNYIFAPSNPSGGLAKEALTALNTAANWANLILFIGDNGQNSETAALFETFLEHNTTTPVVITRDAVDLIKNTAETVLNRAPTHLIVSLSQLQKLFQSVYYPRVVTFSQGVKQIAETLHKFTITYPCTITLWHAGNLLVARAGQVVSQEFDQPMRIWSGEIATRQAVWQIWNADIVQAAATAWTEL
ncbi:hypothetical protein FWC31_02470 [Candidatus Saccharibacteria bacterium]|nr:hypothetical protein [Candidatus Saccharibacteria bacterium]